MHRNGSLGLPSLVGLTLFSLMGLAGWGIIWQQGDEKTPNLSQLSEAEKAELAKKRERFDRLSVDEQRRYRDFHLELENHPETERLTRILVNYNMFLQSLTSIERAKLADLPLDERIAEVQSLKQRQDWRAFNRLAEQSVTPKDLEALFMWIGQVALAHEPQVQDAFFSLNPEFDPARLPRQPIDKARFWSGFVIGQLGEDTLKIPTDEEIEELGQRLSPSAQEFLNLAADREEKLRRLRGWLFVGWMSRRRNTISEEELERFFNEQLTEEERQTLDQKSPEDRMDLLREMYVRRRMNRGARGGTRSGGGRSGGPPSRPRSEGPADAGASERSSVESSDQGGESAKL
jgi:predicted outer membrane protein